MELTDLQKQIDYSTEVLGDYLQNLKFKELNAASSFPNILVLIPVQLLFFYVLQYFNFEIYISLLIPLILSFYQLFLFTDILNLWSYLLFVRTKSITERLKDQELERELGGGNNNPQQRAVTMARKNYFHLERYYMQSLNQSRKIFYFGILLATAGISSIPFIIYFKVDNAQNLAIIQAVLVSFVLVIFQLMYSKTNDSVNSFYKGLLEAYKDNFPNK